MLLRSVNPVSTVIFESAIDANVSVVDRVGFNTADFLAYRITALPPFFQIDFHQFDRIVFAVGCHATH